MLCALNQGLSFVSGRQDRLEDWLKHRLLDLTPRVSSSVGLGWSPENLHFNKFPGGADAAGPGNHCFKQSHLILSSPFTYSPHFADEKTEVQKLR